MNPHALPEMPAFAAYQQQFCAHIRQPEQVARPEGVSAERMAAYSDLIRRNLAGFVDACYPVTRQVLPAATWQALQEAFMVEHACASPLFRDIPGEMLAYVQAASPRVQALQLPPWLLYLMHYEWVELAVEIDPVLVPAPVPLERVASAGAEPIWQLNPTAVLLAYPYAVQHIRPEALPAAALTVPACLVACRNHRHQVLFTELSPVLAQTLSLMQNQAQSLTAACASLQQAHARLEPEQVRTELLAVWPLLLEREVVALAV